MSMSEWAKREVEIACERERANSTEEGEWDYGCACYMSALNAFNSLMNDGHSGYSIMLTKQILNRLIDGKPLTPIRDTEDEWNELGYVSGYKEKCIRSYQCKRMSSLFKDVYEDGTVKYSDVDRVICEDLNNPDNRCTNGFVRQLIDEMFPITMPYMPESKPYIVRREDILTDPKNGDFDTMAIASAIKPNGERINICRYFKESENGEGWVEIDGSEYCTRAEMDKARRMELKKKLNAVYGSKAFEKGE